MNTKIWKKIKIRGYSKKNKATTRTTTLVSLTDVCIHPKRISYIVRNQYGFLQITLRHLSSHENEA